MLRQYPSKCINWYFSLVGLLFIIMQCDARAVNVSNTWTMPQEGLNVFYRFFRDRISWFEADAVCQFHHANLVTVDNSFQFDATRDLLRELDVNDIVWIGLMRPQSSDRFMWSNSRPLVADTGYWAESLPLMDAPLCAVIDPIRDYRWHALRCGGPETASFLCEMPVPSWADACNLKDMPNLTLQYMADTASIELIRNCQEEGLLRTMCRGKQDRERASQDLICPRERLEAQRINDITNSHFKSLQIINSIPSDNNENNNIELLPMEVNYGPHYPEELQTEKNTVQRLIEQFNVDEIMQADEPSNMETVSSFYKIPGLIPKPVKKSAKKVLEYPKKDKGKQVGASESSQRTQKEEKMIPLDMEDELMMGDQPLQGEPELAEQFLNEEVSNEILEPLPHIKKTNIHKEDGLEKIEKEATAMKKSIQMNKEMENKKIFMMSTAPAGTSTEAVMPVTSVIATTTTTTTIKTPSSSVSPMASTTETLLTTAAIKASEDHTHKLYHQHEIKTQSENIGSHLITTTIAPANIAHPIHPQQQSRSNILTEESQHIHAKESADSSHFIPPMLMVKSHYVPPANKHDHHIHHQEQHLQPQQPQQQHEDVHPHLETTTEVQAKTIMKHEENPTPDTTMIGVTTPKVLKFQESILKPFDTSTSTTAENEKLNTVRREEQHQIALATTEGDSGGIKPITEQYTTETEQRKNLKNFHFPDKLTTTTAQIVQSAASTASTATTAKTITTDSEGINKNNVAHEKPELETPQTTSRIEAETTQATELVATTENSLKYTKKLYDLETATDNIEKGDDADAATAITDTVTQIQQQQQQLQHVPTREEEQSEENKEHLQITSGTTEKLIVTKANAQPELEAERETETEKEIITTPTSALAPATQQSQITTIAETQSLQQIQKDETNKEQFGEEDKKKQQDIKEAIVETTEILATSTAGVEVHDKEEEEKEVTATRTTTTATPVYVPITSTSKTTTTTVKPITTTLPQNELKTTETSFSTTSAIMSTTTNIATTTTKDGDNTRTTTKTPPTSTTFTPLPATSPAAIHTINTTEVVADESKTVRTTVTVAARKRALTQTSLSTPPPPPAAPETTRNFLKVTTEIPFKPNRRRSLTKPETVSYMKKILG